MAAQIDNGSTGPAVSTVDSTEIAKFNAMAEAGGTRTATSSRCAANPTRIAFLRDAAAQHFGRVASDDAPLEPPACARSAAAAA